MRFLRSLPFFLFLSTGLVFSLHAQNEKHYLVHAIAFYNLENLFDTENDPDKFDEQSPIMEIKAGRDRIYKDKLKNMAQVISEIGADISGNPPAIIGVSEVENYEVLQELLNQSPLNRLGYGIVHFDSPDMRGIDVALLYRKQLFVPIAMVSHELKLYDAERGGRQYTRDQLLVSGMLDGEQIHLLVNHWPSRRGGELASRPKREAAAKLNKQIIDSLHVIDPHAKIILMGDLNDNPNNNSLKNVLKTQKTMKQVGVKGIYNPFEKLFAEGLGTTAYRDAWSLFDQILITKPFLDRDFSSYRYYKSGIYNKQYLTEKKGRWKGYPKRSFSNGQFTNGYSDHFPVYILLVKETE